MDTGRFDAFVKALAGRRSRRAALRAGGAGFALGAVGRAGTSARAQEASPAADTEAQTEELLFVQPFASGTWAPRAGEAGIFELALTGVPDQTLYFADRPAHDAGTFPTDAFLESLGFDPADPPNAALVAQAADGGEEAVLVVELLNPRHDAAAGTLAYDARPVAEYVGEMLTGLSLRQTDSEPPASFGSGMGGSGAGGSDYWVGKIYW